jgi:hypothetical protein
MGNVAEILGDVEGAAVYRDLRDKRKAFFVGNYVDKATGKTVWSGFDVSRIGKEIDTQVFYPCLRLA